MNFGCERNSALWTYLPDREGSGRRRCLADRFEFPGRKSCTEGNRHRTGPTPIPAIGSCPAGTLPASGAPVCLQPPRGYFFRRQTPAWALPADGADGVAHLLVGVLVHVHVLHHLVHPQGAQGILQTAQGVDAADAPVSRNVQQPAVRGPRCSERSPAAR